MSGHERYRPVAPSISRSAKVRREPGALPEFGALWPGVRAAFGAFTDDFLRYLAANAIWLATFLFFLLAGTVFPAGYAVGLVIVLATCGLGRMVGYGVRGEPANLRRFREGLRHRWHATLPLAVLEVVLVTVALVNVQIGMGGGNLLVVIAGLLSLKVAVAVVAVAAVAWPLLMDPMRDDRGVLELLRLAGRSAMVRPGRVLAVVLLQVLLVGLAAVTVAALLLAPAVVLLLGAHVLVPVADRVEGRGSADALET